jgi:hypothetical protein
VAVFLSLPLLLGGLQGILQPLDLVGVGTVEEEKVNAGIWVQHTEFCCFWVGVTACGNPALPLGYL